MLSPTSSAPGRQRAASHSRCSDAFSGPTSSPRLLPSMSTASKRSSVSSASSASDPKRASSPRRRHTSTAPGDGSRPIISQPNAWRYSAWRPAPQPTSSTRPRNRLSASVTSVSLGQCRGTRSPRSRRGSRRRARSGNNRLHHPGLQPGPADRVVVRCHRGHSNLQGGWACGGAAPDGQASWDRSCRVT